MLGVSCMALQGIIWINFIVGKLCYLHMWLVIVDVCGTYIMYSV